MQLPHHLGGDARAGCDASAELGEVLVGHGAGGEELEVGEEHGWDAIQRSAFLLLDGEQSGFGVEGLAGEDDAGAVGGGGHVAQDAAETVEEWRRAADDVVRCEEHARADGVAVVEDGVVG